MQRLLRTCLLLCLYVTPSCGGAEHDDHSHGPDGDHTHEASTAGASTAADMADAGGATSDTYPLANCPVSGEALGSMGDPVVLNQPGREVQLCCNSCVASYEGDPAKYNAEIDAAIIEAQSASYPLSTCLISGDTLGESTTMVAVDHVVGNRLYKLCCEACVGSLEKDLPKYRAQLVAAAK
ncbi:MAG: hypothetical protein ACI8QC_003815 [Planctomycetota bacterium]|jgi:hypothetical protein